MDDVVYKKQKSFKGAKGQPTKIAEYLEGEIEMISSSLYTLVFTFET